MPLLDYSSPLEKNMLLFLCLGELEQDVITAHRVSWSGLLFLNGLSGLLQLVLSEFSGFNRILHPQR